MLYAFHCGRQTTLCFVIFSETSLVPRLGDKTANDGLASDTMWKSVRIQDVF